MHRPVMTGQRVMTIAKADPDDLKCQWEIELAMPERRMGHMRKAIEKFAPEPLTVSYVTAADPRSQEGHIEKGLSDHAGQGRRRPDRQDDGRNRSGRSVRAEPRDDRHGESQMRSLLAGLQLVP